MKRNIFKLNEVKCWDIESSIYNLTCPRNGIYTLTIPDVDFDTDQNTNWTCKFIGVRSNIIALDVNVPLESITLLNSTPRVKHVTEGDNITFECETSPTKPPSTITWMVAETAMTTGVTSWSRNNQGLTTTRSRFTRTVTSEIHMKDIRCDGSYTETNLTLTSKMIQLAVDDGFYEGIDDSTRESDAKTTYEELQNSQNAGPVARGGVMFGAGVGVGMACLVPFIVAAAVYIVCRRGRQTLKDADPTQATEMTVNRTAQPSDGFYEGIDDSTRESDAKTTYEELQNSQNAGPVARGDGFYEGIDDSTRESDAKTTYEELQISQNAGPVV
ncbi:uncharacterized protein LOC124151285 isoform X2 [Haliotis rufescens]|uniref:uncharacterized protein LOC124151285 isoform X2 n=1 Tax=Haliotis rufescens TaxID=6454 RepID=UPI00201F9CD7|nr:uncharacterized protein LOC124151285 isoform X2 [Haliotis rufescens]